MRYRSSNVRAPFVPSFDGTVTEPGSQPNTKFEVPGQKALSVIGDPGRFTDHDVVYRYKESITDDDTVLPGRRRYKAILHTKEEAAILGESVTTLHFTPPSPLSFWLKMKGYMTRSMPSTPGSVPWTDLVVDLSKQVTDAIRTDFMGAVFLKEFGETVHMIRNPFGIISPALRRAIPRGMTAHTLSSSKNLSSAWLEYRYGWTPLLGDITNFSKLWCKLRESPEFDKVLQTWSRLSARYESYLDCPPPAYKNGCSEVIWNSSLNDPNWFNVSIQGACGYYRLVTDAIVVKANVSCEKLVPFGRAFSLIKQISILLGLGNWMQIRDTLWEVLPFSFVVDWFINFNQVWLPAAHARLQQADIQNLGFSEKRTMYWHPEVLLMYFAGVWGIQVLPGGGSFLPSATQGRLIRSRGGVTTSYQRSVGFPPLTEEIVRSEGLGILHTLDGVSLFLQRFLR